MLLKLFCILSMFLQLSFAQETSNDAKFPNLSSNNDTLTPEKKEANGFNEIKKNKLPLSAGGSSVTSEKPKLSEKKRLNLDTLPIHDSQMQVEVKLNKELSRNMTSEMKSPVIRDDMSLNPVQMTPHEISSGSIAPTSNTNISVQTPRLISTSESIVEQTTQNSSINVKNSLQNETLNSTKPKGNEGLISLTAPRNSIVIKSTPVDGKGFNNLTSLEDAPPKTTGDIKLHINDTSNTFFNHTSKVSPGNDTKVDSPDGLDTNGNYEQPNASQTATHPIKPQSPSPNVSESVEKETNVQKVDTDSTVTSSRIVIDNKHEENSTLSDSATLTSSSSVQPISKNNGTDVLPTKFPATNRHQTPPGAESEALQTLSTSSNPSSVTPSSTTTTTTLTTTTSTAKPPVKFTPTPKVTPTSKVASTKVPLKSPFPPTKGGQKDEVSGTSTTNNKTDESKSFLDKIKDYGSKFVAKYGPGEIAGIVSAVTFSLVLLLCCFCRCRKRRKYARLRKLKQYGRKNDFLLSDKQPQGIYQSDRMTLLDDSSEEEL